MAFGKKHVDKNVNIDELIEDIKYELTWSDVFIRWIDSLRIGPQSIIINRMFPSSMRSTVMNKALLFMSDVVSYLRSWKKRATKASVEKAISAYAKDDPEAWGDKLTLEFIPNFVARVIAIRQEEEDIEKYGEAPKKAPLGMIAFAGERRGVPYEVDTQREEELFHNLQSYISGDHGQRLSNKDINDIKKFIDAGWYQQTFLLPKYPVIYRGMAVSKEWLVKALGMKKSSEVLKRGTKQASFTFSPKLNASSWTSSVNVANDFAFDNQTMNRNYIVTLYARTQTNNGNLLDCKGLYDLRRLQIFSKEKEVIAFGKIKVFKISWYTYRDD